MNTRQLHEQAFSHLDAIKAANGTKYNKGLELLPQIKSLHKLYNKNNSDKQSALVTCINVGLKKFYYLVINSEDFDQINEILNDLYLLYIDAQCPAKADYGTTINGLLTKRAEIVQKDNYMTLNIAKLIDHIIKFCKLEDGDDKTLIEYNGKRSLIKSKTKEIYRTYTDKVLRRLLKLITVNKSSVDKLIEYQEKFLPAKQWFHDENWKRCNECGDQIYSKIKQIFNID